MTNMSELIRKYEPVLRFGTDKNGSPELFFPMAARDFVHTCGLRRRKVGWDRNPGQTSLTRLSTIPKPENCYLVFAAGDVPDFSADMLMELADNGLLLGQSPAGSDFALESLDAGSQVKPRILLGAQQAEALEAEISSRIPVERHPVSHEEFSGWFGDREGNGAHESLDTLPSAAAFDTAAATLEWLEFPALNPLPEAIREWAVQKYAPFREWNKFPPVYHYHACHDRGYLVLQYWFLYPYNDWASHGGNNDHEGDWEVIYVFLDEREEARHVAYSKHVTIPFLYAPETAVWQDVEKIGSTHPVVYVGCGSHASYLRRGEHRYFVYIDRAKGDHLAIGPGAEQAWGEPVLLTGKKWNSSFSGAWGALLKTWLGRVLPDTEGPSSPAQKGDKWLHPAKWAGLPFLR
jgi:hypothetical protein